MWLDPLYSVGHLRENILLLDVYFTSYTDLSFVATPTHVQGNCVQVLINYLVHTQSMYA